MATIILTTGGNAAGPPDHRITRSLRVIELAVGSGSVQFLGPSLPGTIAPVEAQLTYVVVEVTAVDPPTAKFQQPGYYYVKDIRATNPGKLLIGLSQDDQNKLRSFENALARNAGNPLSGKDVKHLIGEGLLEEQGVSVRLTPIGRAVLEE